VLTEDFRAVMEEVSGRDLEWFFRQWIYEPGYPTLEVTQNWTPNPSGSEGTAEITIRQVQSDDWPTFRLPIEILVAVGDRELLSDIEIFERETVIRMEGMTSEPTEIVLDPNGWVLKGGS
jgi:aminopeptidase N